MLVGQVDFDLLVHGQVINFDNSATLCTSLPLRMLSKFLYFQSMHFFFIIMKTRLFKYIENFTTEKGKNFYKKNLDIFHISAQT